MAERRMFAKSIINSAKFLRMPATSRLLYYDLGMNADDDGVVEAFAVLRLTGAQEDDLRVLVSKGYIKVLNEDLVSYINDWKTNNFIRGDRYRPSIYQDLLIKIEAEDETENDGIPCGIPSDNQLTDKRETQVRIGKVSKGKNNNMSIFDDDFEELWKMYPKKDGKTNAKKAFVKAMKAGVAKETIADGIRRYIAYIQATGQYVKNGSTWFNQECWNDEYKLEGRFKDERGSTDPRKQYWNDDDPTVF